MPRAGYRTGKDSSITLQNLKPGEVWIAAGQSNRIRSIDILKENRRDLRRYRIDFSRTPQQLVADRLANIALQENYGKKIGVIYGPMYHSHRVEDDAALVRFNHVGSGLKTRDGQPPDSQSLVHSNLIDHEGLPAVSFLTDTQPGHAR